MNRKPTAGREEDRFELIAGRALSFAWWLLILGGVVVAVAAASSTLAAAMDAAAGASLPVFSTAIKGLSGGLLAAGAAATAGALLGLLFGIPKSTAAEVPPAPPPDGQSLPPATPRPQPGNTSLEQVADWLTKLLLGAGLTQLGPIRDHLLRLAGQVGDAVFGGGDGAGRLLGLALLCFFGSVGFIGGWLATKLRLAEVLVSADVTVQRLLESARQTGRREGSREVAAAVNQEFLAQGPSAVLEAGPNPVPQARSHALPGTADEAADAGAESPPASPQEAARWEPGSPVTNPVDPQKNRFGGANAFECNGRRLEASVKPLTGPDSDLFALELLVRSTDPARPLRDPVKFFLHDTFKPNDTPVVLPDAQGMARLNRIVWGAFTVGAMTDGGQTRLELDLEFLPGAPEKFRSR